MNNIYHTPAVKHAWVANVTIGGHYFEFGIDRNLASVTEAETIVSTCVESQGNSCHLNFLGWTNTPTWNGSRLAGKATIAYDSDDTDDLDINPDTKEIVAVTLTMTQHRDKSVIGD